MKTQRFAWLVFYRGRTVPRRCRFCRCRVADYAGDTWVRRTKRHFETILYVQCPECLARGPTAYAKVDVAPADIQRAIRYWNGSLR